MTEKLIVYAAVLIFAAWLTHALLGFLRGRGAATPPKEGTLLASLGITVRLRDFYRLAVLIEEEGMDFYLRMAKLAQKPETAKLCLALAEEETAHKRKFQDQLDRWHAMPVNPVEWPVFLENARKAELFDGPPDPAATEDELARFAIRQEVRTARFYQSFEQAFPDAWRRAKMSSLVQEELGHAEKLKAAFPHLA